LSTSTQNINREHTKKNERGGERKSAHKYELALAHTASNKASRPMSWSLVRSLVVAFTAEIFQFLHAKIERFWKFYVWLAFRVIL
jgi:hypothetical protein